MKNQSNEFLPKFEIMQTSETKLSILKIQVLEWVLFGFQSKQIRKYAKLAILYNYCTVPSAISVYIAPRLLILHEA